MTLPTQFPPPASLPCWKKHGAIVPRLIFAIDATASREATWDMAAQLRAAMFEEAAKTGGLEVQLVYYRGPNEVRASSWVTDTRELVDRMSRI